MQFCTGMTFFGHLQRFFFYQLSQILRVKGRHYGSWEPPGQFLDHCKFLFSLVQSSHAGIKNQSLKNISSGTFWKKLQNCNFTSYFAYKIYLASRKYFLIAYLNSWCYFLSIDKLHCIFSLRIKIFIFLAAVKKK